MANLTLMLRVCAMSLCLVGSRSALGGDLNPPPGPVAPTMKTLAEVEPRIAINATHTPGDADSVYRIAQAGSYYLAGNTTGVSAKHGIEIAASGVTLDLMGFDLIGVGGSLDGVNASGALENIGVLNGSIRGWGQYGVKVSSAANTRMSDLRCSHNSFGGLRAGDTAVITGCVAWQNPGFGIGAGSNAVITNCAVRENVWGISADVGSTITSCSAAANTVIGIEAGAGSTIINCAVRDNVEGGIGTREGTLIINCSAVGNGHSGIGARDGSTISNCSAHGNGDWGIVTIGPGTTITQCVASLNDLAGIRVESGCTVRGNTCDGNGANGDGAGIHAVAHDNRIEGNVVNNNDSGLDVDGVRNLITGNSARGNGANYANIAAGNFRGTIVSTEAALNSAQNALVNFSF